jgi:DNA modification methylase
VYKPKDLIGIPWMLAFSLRNAGWYLRQDIIWHKPNPMPESVTDRCTKSHEYVFLFSKSQKYYFDHEAIQEPAVTQGDVGNIKFGGNKYGGNNDTHYATYSGKEWAPKTKNCQYDGQTPNTMHIKREMGMKDDSYTVRNKRDVWSINVAACKEAHFATYPIELVKPCILAGCPVDGVVLDPFMGSGTTALVAKANDRNYIGIELNKEYIEIADKRMQKHFGLFL